MSALDDSTLNPRKKDVPDGAYRIVELRDLKGNGFLDGPHVTTKATYDRVKRTDGDFLFRRPDRAFKEVMVYYHIDSAARRLHALGFAGIFTKPIQVDVDGSTHDQSCYDPDEK